jgi:hypothetical protein
MNFSAAPAFWTKFVSLFLEPERELTRMKIGRIAG